MTPQELVEQVTEASKSGVCSIVLYGSAAAGDHVGKRSDFNVLVVTESLGLDELKALSKVASKWMKAGNPPPLLFTRQRLIRSADVFPIEILDIKDAHKVLCGEDIIPQLPVARQNLRLQVEHELKGKLIQLREGFLVAEGKNDRIVELMIESLSSFLVLFRAALRLYQEDVPVKKLDALDALNSYFEFDKGVFETIEELKEGKTTRKEIQPEVLFERYLNTIETVVDAIDRPTGDN